MLMPGVYAEANERTNPVFDVPVGRPSVVACGHPAKGLLVLRGGEAPRRGHSLRELLRVGEGTKGSMNTKRATNRCRWCGTRLRFDLVLALLSPAEALLPFISHARHCRKFPPERRKKWGDHARRLAVKVN
jgi:hypothetical protein